MRRGGKGDWQAIILIAKLQHLASEMINRDVCLYLTGSRQDVSILALPFISSFRLVCLTLEPSV